MLRSITRVGLVTANGGLRSEAGAVAPAFSRHASAGVWRVGAARVLFGGP